MLFFGLVFALSLRCVFCDCVITFTVVIEVLSCDVAFAVVLLLLVLRCGFCVVAFGLV